MCFYILQDCTGENSVLKVAIAIFFTRIEILVIFSGKQTETYSPLRVPGRHHRITGRRMYNINPIKIKSKSWEKHRTKCNVETIFY